MGDGQIQSESYSEEDEGTPITTRMLLHLGETKTMAGIKCDKTENELDFDNCTYTIRNRETDHTLALICDIEPGKSWTIVFFFEFTFD